MAYKISNKEYNFDEGAIFHPGRDSAQSMKNLEQEIGIYNYKAQYLQEPIEDNCSLLKLEDISFYDELPCSFDYFVQSWDSAIQISEKADFIVWSFVLDEVIDKKYYLISMDRVKYTYPNLKIQVEKFAKIYNPKYLLIEDKARASGQQLIQDLRFNNTVIL